MPIHSNISLRVSRGVVLFGIAALVGWIGADADAGTVRRAKAITNEQTRSGLTVDLSLRVKKGEPILARLQSPTEAAISMSFCRG